MGKDMRVKVTEVLELMRKNEVSMKDLSFGIADSSLCDSLADVQRKIKGFLYEDKNILEYDVD